MHSRGTHCMITLAVVHIVSFMLPSSPILLFILALLGVFLVLRLAARFIEVLPG